MPAAAPAVCPSCAPIFPDDWPRDAVLSSRTLGPMEAAQQLLVFTRIIHGSDLGKRHRSCLAECSDWLRRLRSAARQVRVVGVERAMLELWMRQLREAHLAVERELDARSEAPAADAEAVRRSVRAAMNAVGWHDFGLHVDAAGRRVRILYAADQHALRTQRRAAFQRRLAEILGADVLDGLDVKFAKVEE